MGKAALALLVFLLLGVSSPQLDQQEQATALLSRAAELSNIGRSQSEPFLLRAQVRLLELTDGKEAEGAYTLAWESPSRWRAQIDFRGSYQALEIINEGSQWRQATMNAEPVRAYEIRQVLAFATRLESMSQETVENVRYRSEEGSLTKCVEMGRRSPVALDPSVKEVRELCFDVAAEYLVSEKRSHLTYAFSDYAPWEGRLFPRTLHVLEGDSLVVDVRVSELAALVDPDPVWFEPPNGQEWLYRMGDRNVVSPELIHQVLPEYTPQAIRSGVEGNVFIEAVVTAEGKVVLARLVRILPDNDLNRRALESVLQWRFEPARRAGQPVPITALFTVTFRIRQESLPTGSEDIGIVTGSRN